MNYQGRYRAARAAKKQARIIVCFRTKCLGPLVDGEYSRWNYTSCFLSINCRTNCKRPIKMFLLLQFLDKSAGTHYLKCFSFIFEAFLELD